MDTRAKELMQERGLTSMTLAARMDEKPNVVNTALCRGISSLTVIERFARGLRVPVWEMLHRPEVSAVGHELDEWSKPCDKLRLETLMHEQGMTQAQLAEKMGANRPNVNKWMHSTKLTLATIEQFAKAFGIEDKLYLMFISQEEYDAEMVRRAQPTTAAFDPHDPSPIQTVTEVINNAPSSARVESAEQQLWSKTTQTINNATLAIAHADLECEELLHSQMMVNGIGTEPDLFAQQPEPQEVVMQEGVTYVCGNTRITIVNGVMEIRVQDKKSIM